MGWPAALATTLQNDRVLLTPVQPGDRAALCALALDEQIWRYFVVRIQTAEDFDTFFDAGLADQQADRRAVYTIVDRRNDQVAGSMSLGNLSAPDRRLEIGWSWLGTAFQGTGVNRWAKFALLQHCFEGLAAERVEFKTDVLNLRARQGLRSIGAVEEGTLRSYNPMPGGRRRDAIFYSVLRGEWPAVKQRLLAGPSQNGPASLSR
ncbi:MAG: GNAT family N-acetyltransferase [Jatrophihabitans sp.]